MTHQQSSDPETKAAWREHHRSQLRRLRSMGFRKRLEAKQDMAEIIRRFEEMRRDGKFRQARSP